MTDGSLPRPHSRCILPHRIACQAKPAGSKNGYILYDCSICKHGYIYDSISSKTLQEYYADSTKYSASSFADDLAKQRFPGSRSDALRYLNLIRSFSKVPSPKMLEVGAGWGYASEAAAKMGWKADVIEYSNDCIASLARRLPSESQIYREGFEEFIALNPGPYDAILMSQVLEHALDPLQWLASAHSILSDDGLLLVAVPLYKGFYRFMGLKDPFITPPEHLNFFTRKSLRSAALETGLVPLHVATYSRIPYWNIAKKLKVKPLSIAIYRVLQCAFWPLDKVGLSMVQVQVFAKSS